MMIKHIFLGAALAVAAAGTASAQNFNVALDGYCNTFSLNVTGFQVYGTRGGCGYTVIDGGTVAKVSGKNYYISNDTNDQAEIFTWYFTPPKKKTGAGNWYLYYTDGTQQYELNSGTYSPATQARMPTTRDASHR